MKGWMEAGCSRRGVCMCVCVWVGQGTVGAKKEGGCKRELLVQLSQK